MEDRHAINDLGKFMPDTGAQLSCKNLFNRAFLYITSMPLWKMRERMNCEAASIYVIPAFTSRTMF